MKYAIKILNEDHSRMLQEFLISKDIFWRDGQRSYIKYHDIDYLCISHGSMSLVRKSNPCGLDEDFTSVSTDFIIEEFSKKEISVELTDDYTAYLKDGFVKVGCQEIPFEKVEELYNAIYKD